MWGNGRVRVRVRVLRRMQVLGDHASTIKDVLTLWSKYFIQQRAVLAKASVLDFHAATVLLHDLDEITLDFEKKVVSLRKTFSKFDCVVLPTDSPSVWRHLGWLGGLIGLAACGLCAVVTRWGKRSLKPKIN